MQRKSKFCVQVHNVMESICIYKHMFAQRKLQLTKIKYESFHAFSLKMARKMAENLEKI